MNYFDVIQERHSIRAYQNQPIEPEKLQQILEAINRAPSAGNLQSFEVYLVTKDEYRTALVVAAGGQDFLAQAPVVLVFCAHGERAQERYHRRGVELYSVQDATIACTFAMLTATALGLSSVWVGAYDEAMVSKILGIPQGQRPVAMLPIGYAAEGPRKRERRSLEELIHRS